MDPNKRQTDHSLVDLRGKWELNHQPVHVPLSLSDIKTISSYHVSFGSQKHTLYFAWRGFLTKVVIRSSKQYKKEEKKFSKTLLSPLNQQKRLSESLCILWEDCVHFLKNNIATYSNNFVLVKEKVADAVQYHIRRARQNDVKKKSIE